jgi:hypothetical protein
VGGRLEPLAFGGDAGVGVDGADNFGGAYVDAALGFVDDVTQGETEIAIAGGEEV